jgi:hypothetical protein
MDSKAGFSLSKLCAVSVRDLPIKNRTIGWPRPKTGRGSDNLANGGRPAQANHPDLWKKENDSFSALPGTAVATGTCISQRKSPVAATWHGDRKYSASSAANVPG